jgi:hypothetical protein
MLVFLKFTLLKWDIQLPFIWHFNTYIAAILKLFLIVIVSMMANEYSYGTLKQNLIDGLSKRSSFCLNFDRTPIFFLFYLRVCHEFNFRVCLFFLYRATHRLFWNGIFSGVLCQISWLFLLLFVLGILVKRSAFALGFLWLEHYRGNR